MIPSVRLMHGDCRQIIATLDDNSIHSIVTDPPYELGFMGKKWDNSGIAYDVQLWTECLRVLKPGGHLLAFGGTRTYHRMTAAIEDAGFEIRDSIHWLYGSGFPKSHDVSKGIDKAAGEQGAVIGQRKFGKTSTGQGAGWNANAVAATGKQTVRAPATDAAKQWQGWGTALKPAHEPIVVARKPLVGTVAANVQQHGTGALNIDGARIGRAESDSSIAGNRTATFGTQETQSGGDGSGGWKQNDAGRWPANVITDGSIDAEWVRYFYCAKPSKAERKPAANTHPTVKPLALMRYLVRLVTPPGGTVLEPFAGSGTTLAAAILEGFDAIGCELTDDYLPIIEGRIAWAQQERAKANDSLFGDAT
jgi:site-specific DNA-methyltransferase (adenine-specific)